MKRLLLISCCVLCLSLPLSAQQNYQINGEDLNLITAVEGPATLLWNTIDGQYRYFLKKGNNITELTNNREGGRYQEEFKNVLRVQMAEMAQAVEDTKLTLPSLTDYFVAYNKAVDPNFDIAKENIDLKLLLGPFLGFTNEIFTTNPNNATLFVAGADLELIDEVKLKRHSLVLRFRQTFENDDFQYNASQFSLNYRFKFVHTPTLSVFVNGKFVAYTYSSRDDRMNPDFGDPGEPEFLSSSGGDLSTPATFGLGADYRIGNGQLFVTYNDIFGLGVDSNGEFPVDFSLGYKFRL